MKYDLLQCTVSDGIAEIVNNRPRAMNALNSLFFSELGSLIEELRSDDRVKVLIITGSGKSFAAGADIAEMKVMTPTQAREFSRTGQHILRNLEKLPKPVIAAVNGYALGGGCELAMACDIRIAGSDAKFGQPEVNLGLIPGYGATQRLSRLVGLGNALFLLLSGQMIDAQEAHRIGLIQKVVPPDQLSEESRQLARLIASKGPLSVTLVKEITRRGYLMDFDPACNLESQHFGDPFGNEGLEGMTAFLEKRKPEW